MCFHLANCRHLLNGWIRFHVCVRLSRPLVRFCFWTHFNAAHGYYSAVRTLPCTSIRYVLKVVWAAKACRHQNNCLNLGSRQATWRPSVSGKTRHSSNCCTRLRCVLWLIMQASEIQLNRPDTKDLWCILQRMWKLQNKPVLRAKDILMHSV